MSVADGLLQEEQHAPIHLSQELARDSRFIRQNALTDVLAQLPDDVDTVVEAFDNLAPIIEAAVKGTPVRRGLRRLRSRLPARRS